MTIAIKEVHKTHQGLRTLRGASLTIRDGEYCVLLGSDARAKTQLLASIAGLSHPDSGVIEINGHKLGVWDGVSDVGVVLKPNLMDHAQTLIKNLVFYARLHRVGSTMRTNIDAVCTRVSLVERMNSRLQNLSPGQRRRADLARALIHRPSILLLDDPTSGVDTQSAAVIWRVIDEERHRGTTILLATDQANVAEGADTVCIIELGQVVAYASPQAFVEKYGSLSDAMSVIREQVSPGGAEPKHRGYREPEFDGDGYSGKDEISSMWTDDQLVEEDTVDVGIRILSPVQVAEPVRAIVDEGQESETWDEGQWGEDEWETDEWDEDEWEDQEADTWDGVQEPVLWEDDWEPDSVVADELVDEPIDEPVVAPVVAPVVPPVVVREVREVPSVPKIEAQVPTRGEAPIPTRAEAASVPAKSEAPSVPAKVEAPSAPTKAEAARVPATEAPVPKSTTSGPTKNGAPTSPLIESEPTVPQKAFRMPELFGAAFRPEPKPTRAPAWVPLEGIATPASEAAVPGQETEVMRVLSETLDDDPVEGIEEAPRADSPSLSMKLPTVEQLLEEVFESPDSDVTSSGITDVDVAEMGTVDTYDEIAIEIPHTSPPRADQDTHTIRENGEHHDLYFSDLAEAFGFIDDSTYDTEEPEDEEVEEDIEEPDDPDDPDDEDDVVDMDDSLLMVLPHLEAGEVTEDRLNEVSRLLRDAIPEATLPSFDDLFSSAIVPKEREKPIEEIFDASLTHWSDELKRPVNEELVKQARIQLAVAKRLEGARRRLSEEKGDS